jgi:hypothetical protein
MIERQKVLLHAGEKLVHFVSTKLNNYPVMMRTLLHRSSNDHKSCEEKKTK